MAENQHEKQVVKLTNAIYWDREVGDKVYMGSAQIVIARFPFATRQVYLRFERGPALDLRLADMDNLVNAYLTMRGLKLPDKQGTALKTES
jgi:hypothetical protein